MIGNKDFVKEIAGLDLYEAEFERKQRKWLKKNGIK